MTFVDAICTGCKTVRVHKIGGEPAEWDEGNTFFESCISCTLGEGADRAGEEVPHNIVRLLSGLNSNNTDEKQETKA